MRSPRLLVCAMPYIETTKSRGIRSLKTQFAGAWSGQGARARRRLGLGPTLFRSPVRMPSFPNLNRPLVTVDSHAIAGFDNVERISIKVGDGGGVGDDGPQSDLRRHFVKEHPRGCRSHRPREVESVRPAGRTLGSREPQHLSREAHTA